MKLDELGVLMNMSWIKHQYPHCWRCKHPILFRATEQWFASIDGFRKQALDEIDKVHWIPSWGRDRIYNMIADRGDWCISRQRTWGVPIPIFYCEDCGKELINNDTINHVKSLFREHGSNVWFAREAKELLPTGTKCPGCESSEFRKETDIMDVWFDSGSSHWAVLTQPEYWPDLTWPADLYLEGSDQHRGWFNSSLSTSVAATGKAPYKACLTHGFLVDEQGRKQSKSMGNVTDPLDVIKQMGADILRLWVSSASSGIFKQMSEAYRKIRNTTRYLLGNLYDFNPSKNSVIYEDLLELDKWALLKLQKLIKRVLDAYRNYEFHVVYHAVHNFCAVDMSAFYLDIVKDRLYTSLPDSRERRAAQTVMYEIVNSLVRILTPVLAFTSEEIWKYIPKQTDDPDSVQLSDMPPVKNEYIDDNLEAKWERILKIRDEISKALEAARKNKVIGHSLDAHVKVYVSQELAQFLTPVAGDLATILIVSRAEVVTDSQAPSGIYISEEIPGLWVEISQAKGDKCERCWIYSEEVGKDGQHPTVCNRCLEVVKNL